MDEQLELFSSKIYPDMSDLILKIENKFDFPSGTIGLSENISQKGTSKGKLISIDLCLNEPEYPPTEKTHFVKSSLIIKFLPAKNTYEILIPKNTFHDIDQPSNMLNIIEKDNDIYVHVLFDLNSNTVLDYIEKNIIYCINNYSASSSFGCCSKFKECSAKKCCLHINNLYAKGCQYRKNLEAGRIFY